MRIGLVSNWQQTHGCGVANFGKDWLEALEAAGHTVFRLLWGTELRADQILINWDSGTLPKDQPLPKGCTVFVHHTYRGIPEGLENARLILSPMEGVGQLFPYPVPAHRSPPQAILPKTIGVTTLRQEGVDWLQQAAAQRGYQVCPPDRWRETSEEIDRLSQYAMLALWYADSPGRSLALATALAAQRPLLLTTWSQMFAYATGDPDIYWAPYGHQAEENAVALDRVFLDLAQGTARIPTQLAARWSWPAAIRHLEALWWLS